MLLYCRTVPGGGAAGVVGEVLEVPELCYWLTEQAGQTEAQGAPASDNSVGFRTTL